MNLCVFEIAASVCWCMMNVNERVTGDMKGLTSTVCSVLAQVSMFVCLLMEGEWIPRSSV